MIKIGIIGCGTIGGCLAKAIVKQYKNSARLSGVCETRREKIAELSRALGKKISALKMNALVRSSDLIIEAAHPGIVPELVAEALKRKKNVMIMSVGGLIKNPDLVKKIFSGKIKLYVPSGAIAGVDALKAAKMGRISRVMLTTVKPIAGLRGAPYLEKNKIDLSKITQDTVIFDSTAQKAVAGFPQNINVSAILSLAGIGARKTRVRIIASPQGKRNTHSIEIDGNFGRIVSCTENVPSDLNPKTSQLAVLSALATLEEILGNIKIGT